MNSLARHGQAKIPWYQRLLLTVVGSGLLGMLATAVWLQPDARGYGTHQRLGLPACSAQVLWGIRCPSCGMTTAWAYFVRGRLVQSLAANTGGTLLAAVAVLAVPWLLLSALRGRWLRPVPSPRQVLAGGTALILVTLLDWCLRCFVW